MKQDSLIRRYPLITLVLTYMVVGTASSVAASRDIGAQVVGTALAAIFSLLLLAMLAPCAVGPLRVKADDRKPVLRLAGAIVVAGLVLCLVPAALTAAGFPVGGFVSATEPASAESATSAVFDDPSSTEGSSAVWAALPWAQRVLLVLLLCATTGIFEESYFRGMVMSCAYEKSSRPGVEGNPVLSAAVFSALLFGILHAMPAVSGSAPDAPAWLLAAQNVMKGVQAGMFGFCMAALFVRTRTVWVSALTHALFDLAYLGPGLMAAGQIPATYATGNYGDIVVIALTIALLAAPCVKSARWLGREVLPYSSALRK